MKAWFVALPINARVMLIAALCTAGLLLLLWVSVVFGTIFDGYTKSSAASQKSARLLGYQAAAASLTDALAAADAHLQQLVFPVSSYDEAGARLQQTLRGFAQNSGLTVTGSQLVEEAKDDQDEQLPGLRVLTVDLSLFGVPIALDAFLGEVEVHRPLLALESMDIQQPRRSARNRGKEAPDSLNVRLQVVALQEVE